MTGQRPADRGDTPAPERREGYVTFDVLLTALEHAMAPQTRAVDRLERALTRELRLQTEALANRLDRLESEAEQRITALEQWRTTEEVEEAFRRGFWHVVMLGFRWTTEHWPVAWAIAVMVVGVAWVVVSGGQPSFDVSP